MIKDSNSSLQRVAQVHSSVPFHRLAGAGCTDLVIDWSYERGFDQVGNAIGELKEDCNPVGSKVFLIM